MGFPDFEPEESFAETVYETIEKSEQTGEVRTGTNEVTKAIERNEADLVVIATDVSPKEIVMHIPALAQEKDVPYTFVTDKEELGLAAGIQVQAASVAITKTGNAEEDIQDVAQKSAELIEKEE